MTLLLDLALAPSRATLDAVTSWVGTRYRPRRGVGLWLGLTALDVPFVGAESEGLLSMAGFLTAWAWASLAWDVRFQQKHGDLLDD